MRVIFLHVVSLSRANFFKFVAGNVLFQSSSFRNMNQIIQGCFNLNDDCLRVRGCVTSVLMSSGCVGMLVGRLN